MELFVLRSTIMPVQLIKCRRCHMIPAKCPRSLENMLLSFVVMFLLLWCAFFWSLNEKALGFELEKTRLQVEKLSRELHSTLEEHTGKQQLKKAYEMTTCSTLSKESPDVFLEEVVSSIEKRFNDTRTALLNLKASVINNGVQNSTRGNVKLLVQDCCTYPSRPLPYITRFLTEVNTSAACENLRVSHSYNATFRVDYLLDAFRNNLKDSSSLVSWQYFGSSHGDYLQYPTSPRICNSSNIFDPRFKSWYVNAVSRSHVNIVVIIDRSGSMLRRGRMELARQAALTVLETLGADDNIGVFGFSNNIHTPSGCFGEAIAQANPSNINRLKKWVRELQPTGTTKYVPAFVQAFKMLANLQRYNQTSKLASVILFLTDGNPYESDDAIFEAIRQGQHKMQNRTIINTYGLGNSLNYDAERRLQSIASQNGGRFTPIRDSDASGLRSIMGQYYSDIPGSVRHMPVYLLPHVDQHLGLVTTMSTACLGPRNDVIGVVALDVAVSKLLKEVVEFSTFDGLSYAAVIDTKGRTLLHPSVPKPDDHLVNPVFQSLSLYEPSINEDMMQKIIASGLAGSAVMEAYMSSSRGDPRTDGIQTVVVNATYKWKPIRSSPYIVLLVTAKDQIETASHYKFVAQHPRISKSYYHRLDLTIDKTNLSTTPVCNRKGSLVSRHFSTVKLAPEAFNDSSLYIATPETLPDVVSMETFFNRQSSQAEYPGLSESVRVEVMLTAQLEKTWNESEHRNPNMIEWRFVATNGGVFRVFPGIRLQKTYSHLRQPWYKRAINNAGRITISRSSSNTGGVQSPGNLLSLLTTFDAPRCNTGNPPASHIAGVVGIQLSQSSFNKIISHTPGLCERFQHDCFIMDNNGYIISEVFNPKVASGHVTQMFPWLASRLASQSSFVKVSWCNNFVDHVVQLFHSLALPRDDVSSSNGTTPCRQYLLSALPETNAYLLVLRSRLVYGCDENDIPECNQCKAQCSNCTGHLSPCQCPCSCSMSYDECTNSVTGLWTGIPCPASIPRSRDTSVGMKANLEALMKVPPCPTICSSLFNEVDCNGSRSCHWCRHSSFPVCSEICRTYKRVDVFILFPCNDFTRLSLQQKYELGKSLIKTMIKVSPRLTTTALDKPVLNTTGIGITIHGTTDGIPVSGHRDQIMIAVDAKSFSIGPTENVQRIYTAKSSKEYTNLRVQLYMSPWPATHLNDEQTRDAKTNLQNTLDFLLGTSLASKAHGFHMTKGIISFNLSNEGHLSSYSIKGIAKNLRTAVYNKKFMIRIANLQVFARRISTVASFDYYCNPWPTDSTTSLASVNPSNGSLVTLPPVTQDLTLPPVTEELEPTEKTGLIPTEVFIVIFSALGVASCCPLVLFFAFRRRKKTTASRQTTTTETETEDDVILEDNQSTDEWHQSSSSSSADLFFNRRSTIDSMQIVPDWSRGDHKKPSQATSDENSLQVLQSRPHLAEHRTSIICNKKQNTGLESRRERSLQLRDQRKLDWKESVRKLREQRMEKMKDLAALSRELSEENLVEGNVFCTRQQTSPLVHNTSDDFKTVSKSPFKQGFIDCDVDTIVAENRNISRSVGVKRYHRSQSNRDISMATFRILDTNRRRQSFKIASADSSPQSLLGMHSVGSPRQTTQDFNTRTRLGHGKPIQAWSTSAKRPGLANRNSSFV